MPSKKHLFQTCFLIFALCLTQALRAENEFLGENAVASYSKRSKKKQRRLKSPGVDSWFPYFTPVLSIEDEDLKRFTQCTIGVGFLYLSKVKGNTTLKPSPAKSISNATDTKKVGGFSYNRTPLYQYEIGTRIASWLKLSLAFQNQNSIYFQSRFSPTYVPPGATRDSDVGLPKTQFRANLSLNSVFVRALLVTPWAMVLKSWAHTGYLAIATGPCWQSWTDIRQYVQYNNDGVESTFVNTLKQKYGASALLQIDCGLRTQPAFTNNSLSFVVGLKFNLWGRVPNLGDEKDQSSWKHSFKKPYSATSLYSFSPYLGGQWVF